MPDAPLYYFDFQPAEWLRSEAVNMMQPEQEGAYWRLIALAWGDGSLEPSLPLDDAKLAQMSRLGARWRKLGPLIREQFVERDGRLYLGWLSAKWAAAQTAYQAKAAAGRKGGETKAANQRRRGEGSANAKQPPSKAPSERLANPSTASPLPDVRSSNKELEVKADRPLTGSNLPLTAPGGALGPDGAAQRATGAPAAEPQVDPQTLELQGAYYERLKRRGAEWIEKNPDDAAEIEETVKRDLGLVRERPLTEWQKRFVTDQVLEAIRDRAGWKTSDEWVADELTKRGLVPAETNGTHG